MKSRLRGKVVAVDFDGVLHSYTSGWCGPVPTDPPNDGAKEFVIELQMLGAVVVVYTSRANTTEGREATIEWLIEHGFPAVGVTSEKPPAIAYVDDRAVVFKANNWNECLHRIDEMVNG